MPYWPVEIDEVYCKCRSCGCEDEYKDRCVTKKCVCCYDKDKKKYICEDIKYPDE